MSDQHITAIVGKVSFVSCGVIEGLFQPVHLLVILGIALLVFGPKKLSELGKGIGEGIRGFKAAMHGDEQTPAGREQKTSTSSAESSQTSK